MRNLSDLDHNSISNPVEPGGRGVGVASLDPSLSRFVQKWRPDRESIGFTIMVELLGLFSPLLGVFLAGAGAISLFRAENSRKATEVTLATDLRCFKAEWALVAENSDA